MRSIFRDFTEDFFEILTYPKERWYEFWKDTYGGKHPRILEEYSMKNCLSDELIEKRLMEMGRPDIDRLYLHWLENMRETKARVIKTIRTSPRDLELKKEDFVVYLMCGLGDKKCMFIPTSKGHVILIDLVYLWHNDLIENLVDVVMEGIIEFRAFANTLVNVEMESSERKSKFDNLETMLKAKLENKNYREAMDETVKFLDHFVEYYNWTGFYLVEDEELLSLGSYVGEPTDHVKIPFGKGICGQAAATKDIFLVPDVSAETNYLACSKKTKAEIVIPMMKAGKIIGELDIDSHYPDSFDKSDSEFLEGVCSMISDLCKGQ